MLMILHVLVDRMNWTNTIQQAAVAFGTSQPYSTAVETPSYSAYMSNNNRASFNSRASNIETYGSLQDIADEDDDEDAF